MFSLFRGSRRKKILAGEFPADWLDLLDRNVWQFRFLSNPHQQFVKNAVRIMSAEKSWEGVDGLEMTAEIMVTISGAASLLTLGLDKPYYFDRIRTIIVHPKTIQNNSIRQGLVVDRENGFYDGQAWQGGPVIFSGPAVIAGTRRAGDGRNVVIHEFAHHIDGLDGEMGGQPIIESPELRARWEAVFDRDFKTLVDDIRSGRQPLIDPYAATNKAEFFAVTSEIFFDSPQSLHRQLPDVYTCLAAFYRIDPLSYQSNIE